MPAKQQIMLQSQVEVVSPHVWNLMASDIDETRVIFNALDQGLCTIEVKYDSKGLAVDYVFLKVNAAFEKHTGMTDVIGRSMRSLKPEHEERWYRIYGEIVRTGEAQRFVAEAKALGRWFDVHAFRVGQAWENKVAILFADITKQRSQEEHLELLNREIEHRARNTLALVASLVRLTTSDKVEDYKTALLARLDALHRSDLVLQEDERRADYKALICEEMAPYQIDGRIRYSGPPVMLEKATTRSLAMGLHELATNAVKYGALSSPAGSVQITWDVSADGHLRTVWRESGGPLVAAPTRKGLGSKVIEQCLSHELGGKLTVNWDATGLCVEFTMPAAVHSPG